MSILLCCERDATLAKDATGGAPSPLPRRPWASHEEGENNGKTDAVDTIVIRSADIESSILVQLSDETMFAVVIFKVASFWRPRPTSPPGLRP